MPVKAIVTIPPYAPFIDEVLRHPIVEGVRLNTVMPVKEPLEGLLQRLDAKARGNGKQFWIDLKCRQLRIKTYGVPPFTEIELTHKIQVNVPTKAYFSDGTQCATVLQVDGNRLIMQEGPQRVVGPGEAVNIPDPSLRVEGYFTDTDKGYIDAGLKVGVKRYMLSFVEGKADIDALKGLYPEAEIVAKIESVRGLDYVVGEWKNEAHLMAARGDLYMEVQLPHHVIDACQMIVQKDREAIVASRIFPSLSESPIPSCQDIGDVDSLLRMGYRRFMLGDDLCMRRETVLSGLNLLAAMAAKKY